ncbi:MAG: glycosyltransferase family A protein [Pseudomonadota bacterium]
MSDITIGVPVYNSAALMAGCLDCLAEQTYRGFTARVFDNASTDATAEIVTARATEDPRILLHRQPRNVGAGQNFLDALAAAETEFFLWRADDDLTAPDYLERTRALLLRHPNAALAVGHVESHRPAKNRVRQHPFIEPRGPRVWTILRRMFRCHPSWIYGLWRTEALRRYYLTTWEAYPHAWANDHLVLLNVILDEAVVGDNATRFLQRIGVRGGAPKSADQVAAGRAEARRLRPIFGQVCDLAIRARGFSALEERLLLAASGRYADKRVNATAPPWRRISAPESP